MVLLNIVYGLIMALLLSLVAMLVLQTWNFNEVTFLAVWGTWTIGHIIYDAVAHQLVKFFNRNDGVYRG